MEKPKLVYVTYIRTTAEKLWQAIIQPEFTREYWGGMVNISDWKKGSKWHHSVKDAQGEVYIVGEIVECLPPKRLVMTWADPDDLDDASLLTFEIEPLKDMVQLNVIHGEFKAGSVMAGKVNTGWPKVLSSLKSYLETGIALDVHCKS